MNDILSSLERQATTSLRIMRRSGITLDLNFQKRFLELSNSRLLTTYFKVQMEGFEENHSQRNRIKGEHGEADDIPTTIEIIDSSDDEGVDSVVRMVKTEPQEDISIVREPEHTNDREMVAAPGNVKNETQEVDNQKREPKPEPLINDIPMTMFNPLEAALESIDNDASSDGNDTLCVVNTVDNSRYSSNSMKRKKSEESECKTKVKITRVLNGFKCEECGHVAKFKQSIETHMRRHTGERPYSCTICSRRFIELAHLNSHLITHNGKRPYSCGVCPKRFTQLQQLKKHQMTHTGEKPHSCTFCSKSFNQKGNLDRHLMIHTGEKPHRCDQCSEQFIFRKQVKRHIIRAHKSRKLPFHCRSCYERYSKKSERDQHEKICSDRHYECYLCKKFVTYSKSAAISHMKVHTGERPFQCDVCMKRYLNKNHIVRHMRSHTGERPAQCDICMKRFVTNCDLKGHLRGVHKQKTH